MVRSLAVLLAVGVLCAGEPVGLDRPITVNLWSDRPSEALSEILVHLPPGERFAWYVEPSLDADLYPGFTLERAQEPARKILDAYCALAKLQWKGDGRHIWLYRPADAAQVTAWSKAFTGSAIKERRDAGEALVKAANPESLTALLAAAGSPDAATAALAREYLTLFLGVPVAGLSHLPTQIEALLGDPAGRMQRRLRQATVGDFDHAATWNAPWAALRVLMSDPAAVALVPPALTAQPKVQSDLVLLVVGAAAKAPQVKEPWTVWKTNANHAGYRGEGWMVNYVQGRAGQAAAWMEDKPQAEVDFAAKAVELNAAVTGVKKQDLDKSEQVLGKILNQVKGFRQLWGEKPAEMLCALTTHEHPLIREEAARALGRYRLTSVVPSLTKAMQQENEDSPRVRNAAAISLGRTRLPEALAVLKAGANNVKSPQTRRDAIRALAENRCPGTYQLIKDRLAQSGVEADERNVLIQLLGYTRSPKGAEDLVAMTGKDAALEDRISAAAGLIVVPTAEARAKLGELLTSKDDRGLRMMTINGLVPRNMDDVERFAPLLLKAVLIEGDEEIAVTIVKALERSAQLIPADDPNRVTIAYTALTLVQTSKNSNVRQEALNVFKYTGANAGIVKALEAVLASLRDAVLKMRTKQRIEQLQGTKLDLPEQVVAAAP